MNATMLWNGLPSTRESLIGEFKTNGFSYLIDWAPFALIHEKDDRFDGDIFIKLLSSLVSPDGKRLYFHKLLEGDDPRVFMSANPLPSWSSLLKEKFGRADKETIGEQVLQKWPHLIHQKNRMGDLLPYLGSRNPHVERYRTDASPSWH